MTIVYRVRWGLSTRDFDTQGAAFEFCKANSVYVYVGLVYRFFEGKKCLK